MAIRYRDSGTRVLVKFGTSILLSYLMASDILNTVKEPDMSNFEEKSNAAKEARAAIEWASITKNSNHPELRAKIKESAKAAVVACNAAALAIPENAATWKAHAAKWV